MERIFFNGYGTMTSEKQIRNNIEDMKSNKSERDIQLELRFANENDRNNFETNFPKYLKFRKTTTSGAGGYISYNLDLNVSCLNVATGNINETGEKRINKFIDVLKKLGYLE